MDYRPKYEYIPPSGYHWLTKFYDHLLILAGFGRKFREKIVNAIDIKPDDKILDVGCGTGIFLELLKKKYPVVSVIGIDPDQEALSIASKRLSLFQNVKLIKAFAEALPFENESFDIVFSTLVFHHLPNDVKQKAVAEIYRVLKPRGKVVIVDFGTSKHRNKYRFITFWENFEYLEGNLKGLIPEFMKQTGFENIEEDSIRWPVIHLIKAQAAAKRTDEGQLYNFT